MIDDEQDTTHVFSKSSVSKLLLDSYRGLTIFFFVFMSTHLRSGNPWQHTVQKSHWTSGFFAKQSHANKSIFRRPKEDGIRPVRSLSCKSYNGGTQVKVRRKTFVVTTTTHANKCFVQVLLQWERVRNVRPWNISRNDKQACFDSYLRRFFRFPSTTGIVPAKLLA